MDEVLRLTARFYRSIPLDNPGLVEEDVELDATRTALVGLHCWNIGCPDGPAIDKAYCVGMGFPMTCYAAYEIMHERILPAMEAARKAGVLVAHVENDAVGQKHLDLMEVPPTTTHTEIEGAIPPSAVPGHRKRITDRAHGVDYPTESPYARMDRVSFLMPKQGEPFAIDSVQLHRMLHNRGIENLVYTGFATDMCVLHSPGGIVEMGSRFDYRIFLIREATIGVEFPDRFEERISTNYGIRRVESHLGHSIGCDDWIANCERLAKK